MSYILLTVGLAMVFFGLLITYVLVKSALNVIQSFEKLQTQITTDNIKKNQIVIYSLPGLLMVVIGVFLINRARK